jgi:ABC-type multidrug transport system ATPase subunit
MAVTDIVTIHGLDHRFGKTRVLHGVDLTVASGECIALLGPNGAGKTTLVNALTGVLAPSAGTVASPARIRDGLRLAAVSASSISMPGFPAR